MEERGNLSVPHHGNASLMLSSHILSNTCVGISKPSVCSFATLLEEIAEKLEECRSYLIYRLCVLRLDYGPQMLPSMTASGFSL